MHQVRLQAAKLRVMGRPIDAGVGAEGEESTSRGEEEEEGVMRAWRMEEAIRGRRLEKMRGAEGRSGDRGREQGYVTGLALRVQRGIRRSSARAGTWTSRTWLVQ